MADWVGFVINTELHPYGTSNSQGLAYETPLGKSDYRTAFSKSHGMKTMCPLGWSKYRSKDVLTRVASIGLSVKSPCKAYRKTAQFIPMRPVELHIFKMLFFCVFFQIKSEPGLWKTIGPDNRDEKNCYAAWNVKVHSHQCRKSLVNPYDIVLA